MIIAVSTYPLAMREPSQCLPAWCWEYKWLNLILCSSIIRELDGFCFPNEYMNTYDGSKMACKDSEKGVYRAGVALCTDLAKGALFPSRVIVDDAPAT